MVDREDLKKKKRSIL